MRTGFDYQAATRVLRDKSSQYGRDAIACRRMTEGPVTDREIVINEITSAVLLALAVAIEAGAPEGPAFRGILPGDQP